MEKIKNTDLPTLARRIRNLGYKAKEGVAHKSLVCMYRPKQVKKFALRSAAIIFWQPTTP